MIPGGETEVADAAARARGARRLPDRARTSRSRSRVRPPTPSSATARRRTSASPAASRARRGPTSCRSARRRRSATRSTSRFDVPLGRLLHPGRRRLLAGEGRGRRPGGSAAPLGGLGRATASGTRPRCSRTAPAASTTAAASSSCSCRTAAPTMSVAGTRGHWLRCRLAARPRSGAEAIKGSSVHAPARDLLDHGRADRRADRRPRRPRTRPTSRSARATARRARPSSFASHRCSRRPTARRSRC